MSNRMWGGRFAGAPAEIMEEINASIDFDKRLCAPGHRRLLRARRHAGEATGILPAEDVAAIEGGLKAVAAEIESGTSRSRARSRTST